MPVLILRQILFGLTLPQQVRNHELYKFGTGDNLTL